MVAALAFISAEKQPVLRIVEAGKAYSCDRVWFLLNARGQWKATRTVPREFSGYEEVIGRRAIRREAGFETASCEFADLERAILALPRDQTNILRRYFGEPDRNGGRPSIKVIARGYSREKDRRDYVWRQLWQGIRAVMLDLTGALEADVDGWIREHRRERKGRTNE